MTVLILTFITKWLIIGFVFAFLAAGIILPFILIGDLISYIKKRIVNKKKNITEEDIYKVNKILLKNGFRNFSIHQQTNYKTGEQSLVIRFVGSHTTINFSPYNVGLMNNKNFFHMIHLCSEKEEVFL